MADDFCVCVCSFNPLVEKFLRFPFQGEPRGLLVGLGVGHFDLALEVGHAGWDNTHRVEVHLKFFQIV